MGRRFDVIVVGMQVIDLLIRGDVEQVFSHETTNAEEIQLLMGGDALNQAVCLSMLGGSTALMSVVGNDRLGDVLLGQLANYPITVIAPKIESKTGISVVLCKPDGQRHFILQTGHNRHFRYEHIDEQAVRDSKILSIGSCMALPAFDGEDTIRLLDLARSAGVVSAMDIKMNGSNYNMAPILESLRHVDYLLPSELDVKNITGVDESPEKMAQALHDMGVKNVILKLGELGCYVSAEGMEKMIPAYAPDRCVDTTGAGDCFTGAFLHAKAKGWDLETCARFANAAGSISVEVAGACGAIRSEAQVLQRMKRGCVLSAKNG